ncbi:MAG: DUF308 domain-containing protein [Bacteroidales bacterium]|nr:DUF308 domain-containing protein [Bacteroidales bacterium]
MKRHFEHLVRKASRVVKLWWLLAIAGILCILAGIAVFVFPIQSYVVLSIIFGVLVLLVGAAQLIIASSSSNYLAMKGYWVVGGVLDILLGIFLCIYPNVTLMLLPVMMGIWMMYHSFMILAFGGDLENFSIKGSGGTIFGGILLLILSIMVLINPFGAGVATILVLTGVGLMVFGFILCWLSMKLRTIHKDMDFDYEQ